MTNVAQQLPTEWFLSDERLNAAVAWAITVMLLLAAVNALFALRLVDAVLAGAAASVAIVPALRSGRWTRTVPWPLLLLSTAPLVVGALEPTLFGLVVSGTGIAGLGMLLVVVLQMTTSVRMTPLFAIAFVVLVTLAFAGFWAVGSAFSAATLGTDFVQTNTALMYVFSAALLGSLVGGVIFRWYFRRQLRRSGVSAAREEVQRT